MSNNEIETIVNNYAYLVVTGLTTTNKISVDITHVKEKIRTDLGNKLSRNFKNEITEAIEKLRDKIYSKCRYSLKVKKQNGFFEKLDYLINRTRRRAKMEFGPWIINIREWDSLGVLTFSNPCDKDTEAESKVSLLFNYLKKRKLISDYVFFVECSSELHINFFCKTTEGIKQQKVRNAIKSFWKRNFGICWVRKYYKRKESKTYWVKDLNSSKYRLSSNCWDIENDIDYELD